MDFFRRYGFDIHPLTLTFAANFGNCTQRIAAVFGTVTF